VTASGRRLARVRELRQRVMPAGSGGLLDRLGLLAGLFPPTREELERGIPLLELNERLDALYERARALDLADSIRLVAGGELEPHRVFDAVDAHPISLLYGRGMDAARAEEQGTAARARLERWCADAGAWRTRVRTIAAVEEAAVAAWRLSEPTAAFVRGFVSIRPASQVRVHREAVEIYVRPGSDLLPEGGWVPVALVAQVLARQSPFALGRVLRTLRVDALIGGEPWTQAYDDLRAAIDRELGVARAGGVRTAADYRFCARLTRRALALRRWVAGTLGIDLPERAGLVILPVARGEDAVVGGYHDERAAEVIYIAPSSYDEEALVHEIVHHLLTVTGERERSGIPWGEEERLAERTAALWRQARAGR